MLTNLTKILLLIIVLSITGCADRHFLSINRTVANDLKFNSVKVVVIDAEFEEIPFTERQVDISSSRILKKGKLKVDKTECQKLLFHKHPKDLIYLSNLYFYQD